MLTVSHIINRDRLLLSTDLEQGPDFGKTQNEAAAPLAQAQIYPLIINRSRHWHPAAEISFLSLAPPSTASCRYRAIGLQLCANSPHTLKADFSKPVMNMF